jgi:hypothetical protein
MKYTILFLMIFAAAPAFAAKGGGAPGPCQQIAQACKSAGFIPGDWKKGDGLWRDCVDPIVQGVSTVPGGSKPLPTVDATVVAACKAKHPKFGGGKVGSVQGNGGANAGGGTNATPPVKQ